MKTKTKSSSNALKIMGKKRERKKFNDLTLFWHPRLEILFSLLDVFFYFYSYSFLRNYCFRWPTVYHLSNICCCCSTAEYVHELVWLLFGRYNENEKNTHTQHNKNDISTMSERASHQWLSFVLKICFMCVYRCSVFSNKHWLRLYHLKSPINSNNNPIPCAVQKHLFDR